LTRQPSAVPIRSAKPRQSLDHQPESPAQITSPKLGPGIGIEHQNHGSKSATRPVFSQVAIKPSATWLQTIRKSPTIPL